MSQDFTATLDDLLAAMVATREARHKLLNHLTHNLRVAELHEDEMRKREEARK